MAIRNDVTLNNGSDTDLYLMKEFLKAADSIDLFDPFFTAVKIDRKNGTDFHCRRMNNPTVSTTASNGTTNKSPRALTATDYVGTINEYNEAVSTARREDDLSSYDSVKEGAKALDRLVRETRQAIRFNVLKAGTNVFYNSSSISSRATVNGELNANMLERVSTSIRAAYGLPVFSKVEATTKIGTSGVEDAFRCAVHPHLVPSLRLLPGFLTRKEYAAESNEVGAWQDFRFFSSPICEPYQNAGASSSTLRATGASGVTAGLCDVYPIIIVGQDAAHATALKGARSNGLGNVRTVLLKDADKSDIFNKQIISAAIWDDLALITAQEWMAVCEVGAPRL